MNRFMVWIGAAGLLLAVATPAAAQEARKGLTRNILEVFAPPTAEQEKKIATTVQMTEEQKTQMKAVNERYRGESQALLTKYRSAYEDVVKLMQETSPDKGQVNERLKAFHQVHAEVVSHEVTYWAEFKSILTPAQNQKFWNLFEQTRVRGGGQGGSGAKGGKG